MSIKIVKEVLEDYQDLLEINIKKEKIDKNLSMIMLNQKLKKKLLKEQPHGLQNQVHQVNSNILKKKQNMLVILVLV